jgi:hypothetical protein
MGPRTRARKQPEGLKYFVVQLRAKNRRGHWVRQSVVLGEKRARECALGTGAYASWAIEAYKERDAK